MPDPGYIERQPKVIGQFLNNKIVLGGVFATYNAPLVISSTLTSYDKNRFGLPNLIG
jgi:hypothetical protein